jgi:hypothetical protein
MLKRVGCAALFKLTHYQLTFLLDRISMPCAETESVAASMPKRGLHAMVPGPR